MELNEKVIGELSSRLKVDKQVLTDALTKPEIESLNLDVEIFTKEEKQQFETNIKKTAYNEGKLAEKEMSLKNLKKAKGLEIEANSLEEFFDKYSDTIKSSFTGDIETKLKEKDTTIENLRKSYQDKETELNQTKETYLQKFKETKSTTLINNELAKIKIDVPEQVKVLGEKDIEKYIESKLEQYSLLFKSKYVLDYDENDSLIIKDKQNNILVDNVQNPLKINDVMQMFAKDNWLTISEETRKGRGGQSSPKTSGDNFKGMSEAEFYAKMKSQGIEAGTTAITPFFLKWKEANK